MRTVKISVPEKLGIEVENYVKSGWFIDEAEFPSKRSKPLLSKTSLWISNEILSEAKNALEIIFER